MGVDGERVNGNDSFKRLLMSLLTSAVLMVIGAVARFGNGLITVTFKYIQLKMCELGDVGGCRTLHTYNNLNTLLF